MTAGGTIQADTGGSPFAPTTIAANVSGSTFTVNPSSGGTLLTSGTNTATGPVTVGAGRLEQNGDWHVTDIAANSGNLGGSGTVHNISASTGTLTPGQNSFAPVGPLHATNYSSTSGSRFDASLAGTSAGSQYSQLDTSGTIDLGSGNSATLLQVTSTFSPTAGDQFTIIFNGIRSPIVGNFVDANGALLECATTTQGGHTYQITYLGGAGHDVVLTADATSPQCQSSTSSSSSSSTSSGSSNGSSTQTSNAAPPPPNAPPNVVFTPLQTIVIAADGSGTILVGDPSTLSFFLVEVPVGALPPGTRVSLFAVSGGGLVSGSGGANIVDAFAVSWIAPDGTSPKAATPIVVLDINANILGGDGLYQFNGGTIQGTDSFLEDGAATVLFTGDPVFAIVGPSRAGAYRMIGSDGGVFPFGGALGAGSTGNLVLNKPIVSAAATPSGKGYWMVASDGGVFPFGDAQGFGSLGGVHLNKPIVGIAATATGRGYWLVASDGGIFPFGDAGGFGSTGNLTLNKPIVGMAATSDGRGYWLVASDGGIFPFGDAKGFGSTGAMHLNKPIVGMAAATDGNGYWLVASDGGIFPFGDAQGFGSTGNLTLNKPIVTMIASPHGKGYVLVASDGGVFPFGDALGSGSLGGTTLNKPIVTAIPG